METFPKAYYNQIAKTSLKKNTFKADRESIVYYTDIKNKVNDGPTHFLLC